MKRGSITIYLALSLSVLLLLFNVLFVGTRDSVIRTKTECSMDAALYSVFAEYNRELLEQYDLLFIDTSYGSGQGSIVGLSAHLRAYMNENFQPKEKTRWLKRDLLSLTATDAEILEYALATDENGALLQRQAVDYIKEQYGLNCMKRVQDQFKKAEDENLLSRDVSAEQNANQGTIDGIELPKRKISEDEWEEVPLNNPADTVNGSRKIGILSLVLDAKEPVSNEAVALSNYVSARNCEEGIGLGEREGLSGAEKLLFDRYIQEKTDCYTTEEKNGLLQYQTEYILAGKASDMENLSWVADRLVFMRQAANISYLFSDGAKQAEAEALALSLSAVILAPELAEPVKLSILYAWAYAESVYDVKHLLEGKKIPLVKTSVNWHFSLQEMLQFRQHLGDTKSDEALEEGLDYKEYLGMLLLATDSKKKVDRMMDVIEMDIRKTKGNSSFRLDTCVDYAKARVSVESGYGYGCEITRSYYYY